MKATFILYIYIKKIDDKEKKTNWTIGTDYRIFVVALNSAASSCQPFTI
jgi:hypothetical protein